MTARRFYVKDDDSWMVEALCRFDPETFFLDKCDNQQKVERARTICDQCPVKVRCLNWALDHHETHHIWAGTTPSERRKMLADRVRLGIAS